jgi:hypothetical protein
MNIRIFTVIIAVLMVQQAWAADPQRSGFLAANVYEKLEPVEIRDGDTAERWMSPQLNSTHYKALLVDDVVLYPQPEPGPQVSQETLDAVRDYFTSSMKKKMAEVSTLATKPGPKTLQVQAAITGVEIKTEGMHVYEVVPVAAIFGGAKALTGNRARDVYVYLEVKLTDSETGELVGAVVRRVDGEKLKNKKEQLDLQHLQPDLDTATTDASDAMSGMLDPGK